MVEKLRRPDRRRAFASRHRKSDCHGREAAREARLHDGESVLVHDKQLQTYDIWPLSQTPLRLLLQSDLNLATSDRVTSASVEPDLVQVEMIDDAKFGGGTLTLVFDRASGELRQWTVTDQRGVQTLVTLYNVEIGNRLAADLFKIDYNAATNASREKRLRN